MTFREILVSIETLKAVMNGTWPRSMAYAISCNIKALNEELASYIDQRKDIALRYAVKDEDGQFLADEAGNLTFATDLNKTRFYEECAELLTIKTNAEVVKFDEKELLKCESDSRYSILTPEQELALGWMIEYVNH